MTMDNQISNKILESLFLFLKLNQKNGLTVCFIHEEPIKVTELNIEGLDVAGLKLDKNDIGALTIPDNYKRPDLEEVVKEKIDFCILFFDLNLLVAEHKDYLINAVFPKSRNILVYENSSDSYLFDFISEKNKKATNFVFVERYSELIADLPFRWYQKVDSETHHSIENYPEISTLINIVKRQRTLLNEYQQEIARVEMESEGMFQEVQRLENDIGAIKRIFLDQISDWQAFEYTSTGKLVRRVIYLKNRILPPEGKFKLFLYYSIKFFQVVKEEGLHTSLILVSQKMKRFWYRLQSRFAKRDTEGRVCSIEEVRPGHPQPVVHTKQIDIIICVHNALEDVRRCLNSISENTTPPYRIILVDDGSQTETKDYLFDFSLNAPNAQLLRSEEATGYTRAANRGLRASTSEYVVLLNSDTIVGPCWIDQMIACAETDEKIGMVGPISNTASWQSVPKVEENGDWAQNPLPKGVTVERMAVLISKYSERIYLDMPLLNGFCLLIKKQLLDEVGLFDEVTFGKGYGEEDDLILRARQAGWKMALAEDTFIYHAQSRSYSSDKRIALSKNAGRNLTKKHGSEIIKAGVNYCASNPVMEGIRARVAITPEREASIQLGRKYAGKRILFLLPSDGPGGGANVVIYEGLAMQKMGVNVEIFNLLAYRKNFENAYPDLGIPVMYREISDLQRLSNYYDAIVATHNETVYWLAKINREYVKFIAGYYIQGFEPLMYNTTNPRYRRALESYSLIPDLIEFTKTRWTHDAVRLHTSKSPEIIGISLDVDLFRPRPNSQKEIENRPLRVAAMVRPEAPYREPEKTMQLLKKASRYYGMQIEPVIFGTTIENPIFYNLPHDFPWQLYGVISSKKVANLLNTVDIFIDYSSHQAMGLTALEAMATGCAVIVPSNGGAVEFCKHEHNSLVADTSNFDNVWQSLKSLIEDDKLRKALQRNAIYDTSRYYPEKAALNILKCLFEQQ